MYQLINVKIIILFSTSKLRGQSYIFEILASVVMTLKSWAFKIIELL